MKTVTLREWGSQLPIPIKLSGIGINLPKRSFAFKPWRMAEEKKAGVIKQKHKHPSVFVREILSEMLTEVGGVDWATFDSSKKALMLSMLPYGSIHYFYLSLRISALGSEFRYMPTTCPRCSTDLPNLTADLNDIDVAVVEDSDPESLTYELRHPFRVGEVDVHALVFSRTPWDAIVNIPTGDMQNPGALKDACLTYSLTGAKSKDVDGDLNLDRTKMLDQLTKIDLEHAYKALSEFNGGPMISSKCECHKCGHTWGAVIDWSYDHFFGSSSL